MAEFIQRRQFLARLWGAGTGLIAVAAAWTSWDLLQPLRTTGFGGLVRAIRPEAVPDTGIVEVAAARSYLTKVDGETIALSEKCTHLGCRVPFCESSGRFECPCHGSKFSRSGEYVAGPAPRGMDRYPTSVNADDGHCVHFSLIADIAGGTYPAVINILLALRDRDRTGKGCHLDIAMAEGVLPFLFWAQGGGQVTGRYPGSGDSLLTGGSPRYRLYPTSDGRFVAAGAIEQKFWEAFTAAIGLAPALRHDQDGPNATIAGVARIIAALKP